MDVLDVRDEPEDAPLPLIDASRSTNMLVRMLVGGAGIVLLLVGALVSFGGVLLAPLAIWIATRSARRKGKSFTAWPAWIAASGTICVVTLVVTGTIWARTGGESLERIRQNMDSISAAQGPQATPEWARRISPPGSQERADAMTKRMAKSTPVLGAMLVFGGIMAAEFYAIFVGTLGWGGTLLLLYSSRGRWLA